MADKHDPAVTGLLGDIADMLDALSDLDAASREFVSARTAPVREAATKIREFNVVPAATAKIRSKAA